MRKRLAAILVLGCLAVPSCFAEDIVSVAVTNDLSKPDLAGDYWAKAKPVDVTLMAQPMVAPRPEKTTTDKITVRSVHNADWISFRVSWKDADESAAGKLGKFSDALAIQFPVKEKEVPPPVFMGAKGDPVHIFHWRAQYQQDVTKGKPKMKDLYPNLNIDVYPMEYPDWGSAKKATDAQREEYSPGLAAGNPQAYQKHGVDEIYAEGFATSSVQEGHGSLAFGKHEKDTWDLVITRKLNAEGGSVLQAGKKSYAAFAVWQGDKGEAGSRKSVTMTWTPLMVAGGS